MNQGRPDLLIFQYNQRIHIPTWFFLIFICPLIIKKHLKIQFKVNKTCPLAMSGLWTTCWWLLIHDVTIGQCSSHSKAYKSYLKILLNADSNLVSLRSSLEFCITNKLPGETSSWLLLTIFWVLRNAWLESKGRNKER